MKILSWFNESKKRFGRFVRGTENAKKNQSLTLGQPSMRMIFTEKSSQIFDITLPAQIQSSRNNETTRCISPAINSRRESSCTTGSFILYPLIVTPNAGEDLIDEGLTGFIILSEIQKKLPKNFNLMESTTQKKTIAIHYKKAYSWDSYARKIIDFNLD